MVQGEYKLVDFGTGRKLESFAGRLIDRPSPAAEDYSPREPADWKDAESVFLKSSKSWQHKTAWPESLVVSCSTFSMPVAPTPFGHLGIFPEQADNWSWLQSVDGDQLSALNLFGYTGASTIALAKAGFHVAHVDAARPNVQAARHNAQHNELESHPIRYLVDDAAKFTAREVRRAKQYHTIVLDPPAYGHGPSGKTWRLERDLWPMLDDCLRLLDPSSFRLLITGHSPQVSGDDVEDYIRSTNIFPSGQSKTFHFEKGRSQLRDQHRRSLDAGFFVRVSNT